MSSAPGTPTLQARPVFGQPIDTRALRRPMVLAFLRDVRSPLTRAAVADLHELWPDLDRLGIGLVAVVRGSDRDVRDFVPRHHVLFPVIHGDPALYASWHVQRATAAQVARSLRPAALRQAARALETGLGLSSRGAAQLTAAFVLDAQGRTHYRWHAQALTDPLPIQRLAAQATELLRQQ